MTRLALHVRERGEGPPVLFLHGFAGSGRNWGPQLRGLEGFRGLAFDARGHGRSPAPREAGAYRLEAFVEDTLALCAERFAEPAVGVGLSMGAVVALASARREPDVFRGLVLASFPAGRGGGGFSGSAVDFAEAIERDGVEAAGARYVWGADSGLDDDGAALVRQGFLEHEPHALAGILRELLAPLAPTRHWAAELAGLSVPVALVNGARDPGSLASTAALADACPSATRTVIPGAGHVVNLAAPKAFNASLAAFLRAL